MARRLMPLFLLWALTGCSVPMPASHEEQEQAGPVSAETQPQPEPSAGAKDPLDVIVFGNKASESAHAARGVQTEMFTGALGEPARRFLPLDPVDYYGGTLTFTVAVDPVRRNYFTAKFWSDDDTAQEPGRVYLYIPQDGVDYQVGYRHEGDYMPLAVNIWKPGAPGRFFYSTTMLPLPMTLGRTSLVVKLASTGRLYTHGHGGQKEGGNYQFLMDRPSRGVYRAYTHVNPMLDVAGEVTGSAPAASIRPAPGAEVLKPGGAYYESVTKRIRQVLGRKGTGVDAYSLPGLAEAYHVKGLAEGYRNQAIVDKVVEVVDAYAAEFYAGKRKAEGWGGAFGQLGLAIHWLADELKPRLGEAVDFGPGHERVVRRTAWGDLLFASREFGRFNRRTISNQNFLADENIYMANRGLQVVGDARAFPEKQAQRYLREACGLEPWKGNDLRDGGHAWIYGTNYMQVTAKGLTREWGFVGCGYGEMTPFAVRFYRVTGNPEFLAQAVKMAKARAPFRRPAVEPADNTFYCSMQIVGLIAWRGAVESEGQFYNEMGYAGRGAFPEGFALAVKSQDRQLVGYCKHLLEDNQYYSMIAGSGDVMALQVADAVQQVAAMPDPGVRLPMADGQPDFAWADEDDRILALKHGDERLWITPYWQAKKGSGINGVAKFQYDTVNYTQFGVLETVPQFVIGGSYTRPPEDIDKPEGFQWKPPEPLPLNAYGNEVLPLAPLPPGATADDPSRGKADFYAFRFGRYLMGINASDDKTYPLKTPRVFGSALDLVSGQTLHEPVDVKPRTSVALVLEDAVDLAPVPGTPLMIWAEKGADGISLRWSRASGAVKYTVKRAESIEGPYSTIAEGVGEANYIDTEPGLSGPRFYKVSAVNAHGEGYDSAAAAWSASDVNVR